MRKYLTILLWCYYFAIGLYIVFMPIDLFYFQDIKQALWDFFCVGFLYFFMKGIKNIK